MIPAFVAVFFIEAIPFYRFIALGIFVLACLTDFLDGYLARKLNQVTTLGKFLDPIADKLLVACALVAVCFLNREIGVLYDWGIETSLFQVLIGICAMIILCRELFISGFRIVASSKNIILSADKLGKIKTVFQMFALIFLIPVASIIDIDGSGYLSVFNEDGSMETVAMYSVGDYFYLIGFGLLIIATLLTIVSGINYMVKNKGVLKD